MNTYVLSLFAISAVVAVSSYVSYGENRDKTLKGALGVVLIYFIASPTVTAISGFFDSDFHKEIFTKPEYSFSDTDFSENAEAAFCEGVRDFVSAEFSLSKQEIKVISFDFDAGRMTAKKIKIILYGAAALSDNRLISERVEGEGLGACEVELDFG